MFRSLRFRVPALFLVGVVASGFVAAAVAFQLLQSYTLQRARAEVRREVIGVTQLYTFQAIHTNVDLPRKTIERAIADRLFFVPAGPLIEPFPGSKQIPKLPASVLNLKKVREGKTIQFEFRLPGSHTMYIAAASPLNLKDNFWGVLVVAN